MAHELRGVSAAPGVAIATPWIHRPDPVGAGERRSLDEAADAAASELESLAQRLRTSEGPSDEAA